MRSDPAHPLTGCTLPLVHPMRMRSMPVRVVVRLPSGEDRAVGCPATELAAPAGSSQASAVPASSISANILLPVVQHVHSLLAMMEERTNETTPNSAQAAAGLDDSVQHGSNELLARSDAGPTATAGARARVIALTDAPAKSLSIDGDQS